MSKNNVHVPIYAELLIRKFQTKCVSSFAVMETAAIKFFTPNISMIFVDECRKSPVLTSGFVANYQSLQKIRGLLLKNKLDFCYYSHSSIKKLMLNFDSLHCTKNLCYVCVSLSQATITWSTIFCWQNFYF